MKTNTKKKIGKFFKYTSIALTAALIPIVGLVAVEALELYNFLDSKSDNLDEATKGVLDNINTNNGTDNTQLDEAIIHDDIVGNLEADIEALNLAEKNIKEYIYEEYKNELSSAGISEIRYNHSYHDPIKNTITVVDTEDVTKSLTIDLNDSSELIEKREAYEVADVNLTAEMDTAENYLDNDTTYSDLEALQTALETKGAQYYKSFYGELASGYFGLEEGQPPTEAQMNEIKVIADDIIANTSVNDEGVYTYTPSQDIFLKFIAENMKTENQEQFFKRSDISQSMKDNLEELINLSPTEEKILATTGGIMLAAPIATGITSAVLLNSAKKDKIKEEQNNSDNEYQSVEDLKNLTKGKTLLAKQNKKKISVKRNYTKLLEKTSNNNNINKTKFIDKIQKKVNYNQTIQARLNGENLKNDGLGLVLSKN